MSSRHTPQAFAQSIRQAIADVVASSNGRKSIVERKLRTVLAEAGGWTKRGSTNVNSITVALEAEGVYTSADLREPRLDEYVCFALRPIRLRRPRPRFVTERSLVAFIEANHYYLFRDIRELGDTKVVDTEVEYQHTAWESRADLVFARPDGTQIPVEVELGDPQENSAFQLLKYMRAAKANLGVLITAQPTSADLEELVKEALELMAPERQTIWLQYDVGLTRLR